MGAEIAVGTTSLAFGAINLDRTLRGKGSIVTGVAGIGIGVLALTVAVRDDATMPAFEATTGLFSIVTGILQVRRATLPARASDAEAKVGTSLHLDVVPRPDGRQALAVQLRF